MTERTPLACACGEVRLVVSGRPIIATECCCTSCRTAAGRLGALPGASGLLNAHGGTHFVLYRKDRIDILSGADCLAEFRLAADSPTRRIVATCCNTPVFLEFQNGHWLSLYAGLWPAGAAPAATVRTMTQDLPAGTALDDSVPSGRRATLGFYARLLGAWIAMGFRTPKLSVPARLDL